MNIRLIAIGKTDDKHLIALIEEYRKRLSFYIKFEFEIIADIKNVKNLSEIQQKEKEGELILSKITAGDQLVLLDENGQVFLERCLFRRIAEENEFGCQNTGFCHRRPVRIFSGRVRQSECYDVTFDDDFLASDGAVVFHRAVVPRVHDFEE